MRSLGCGPPSRPAISYRPNPYTTSQRLILLALRGVPGDEAQDYGYNLSNTRRRSNSSSYGHSIGDFKTKFEAVEADPVFEEELHGDKGLVEEDETLGLEKEESGESIGTASVDEEERAKKI